MNLTKEKILFAVVGLGIGCIAGFFFANSVNRNSAVPPPPPGSEQQAGLPAGHPSVPGGAGGAAIPEITEAIEKARQDPSDFEAQVKAAELYYQIQRFDGAIEFLKKANELRPEDYDVLVSLGNATFDAGKLEDAEKIYAKALAKKPDDLSVRTDMGLTFMLRDQPDYDRAVQEFKRVLEADAENVQALQNLTVAYTKKSDKTNALATLARLEKAEPSNEAIPKLRESIEKIGK